MRSQAERDNRQTFASLTLTGTLGVGGVITGAGYSGGPISGTTATFSGVGQFDTLVLNKATNKGIKVDTAAPTYPWQDMLGSITTKLTGPTAPTFSAFQGGIYEYAFDRAGMQEVFVSFHIMHDYVPGTDIYAHAHWSTIVAATGNVDWMFELSYAKGYNQGPFAGHPGFSSSVTTRATDAGSSAFYHLISECQISAPDGMIASNVNVSITAGAAILTSASALFAQSDIGRSVHIIGAGAAGAHLVANVITYTSATQVTLSANAGTTVTNQPNFGWAVLDSNDIQVDGVIQLRVWRDSTRVSDTLTQIPFLHFADMHYQSTSIGTKQKNGPAFYT